jgi:crotonobetainyl-CoA:carnitine CoA-transferase CaiB-like acyl-CoA transferase
VPCGLVRTPAEVLADPHLAARGLLQQVAGHTVLRQPLIVDGAGPGPTRGVPGLGEHTATVLN